MTNSIPRDRLNSNINLIEEHPLEPGPVEVERPPESWEQLFAAPPLTPRSRTPREYQKSSESLLKNCENSGNREIQKQGEQLRNNMSSMRKLFRHPAVKGAGTFLLGVGLTTGVVAVGIVTFGLGPLAFGLTAGVIGCLGSGLGGGAVYRSSKSSSNQNLFSNLKDEATRISKSGDNLIRSLSTVRSQNPSVDETLNNLQLKMEIDCETLNRSEKINNLTDARNILGSLQRTQRDLQELVNQYNPPDSGSEVEGSPEPEPPVEIEMVNLPNSEIERSESFESLFGFAVMEDNEGENGLGRERSVSDLFNDPGKLEGEESNTDLEQRHSDINIPVDIDNIPLRDDLEDELDPIYLDYRETDGHQPQDITGDSSNPGLDGEETVD